MKLGDRVQWTSHKEKERTGTFIMDMRARPGFVLIKGDDDAAHVMRASRVRFVDRPGRGAERLATRGA